MDTSAFRDAQQPRDHQGWTLGRASGSQGWTPRRRGAERRVGQVRGSKAPVARADQPTKRKPTTFGAEQGNTKKQRSIAGMSLHTSKSDTSNDDEDDDDDGSTRDETESSHDD